MALITYPNKNTGDTFTGAEATEIKTVVNTNRSESDTSLGLRVLTSSFVDNETPNATGNPLIYNLQHVPIAGSVKVYIDTLRMKAGVDYTISGQQITLTLAPSSWILCDYRK